MCHGDKSDKRVLFHWTGSISSDESRLIGLLIMNAMWFKLLITFQLRLLLQLAKLFFSYSYSYSYQYFPVTVVSICQLL